jgi:PTH2 family peptidyl-tRNA hydrolase
LGLIVDEDTENSELRLYCLIRTDLHLFCLEPTEYTELMGKLMAQTGHAFVSALYESDNDIVDRYMGNAQPKIVLKAKNENVLRRSQKECKALGIACYLVTDAGRTVFREPTVTCLGIGPVMKSQLPKYVTGLQLL